MFSLLNQTDWGVAVLQFALSTAFLRDLAWFSSLYLQKRPNSISNIDIFEREHVKAFNHSYSRETLNGASC